MTAMLPFLQTLPRGEPGNWHKSEILTLVSAKFALQTDISDHPETQDDPAVPEAEECRHPGLRLQGERGRQN